MNSAVLASGMVKTMRPSWEDGKALPRRPRRNAERWLGKLVGSLDDRQVIEQQRRHHERRERGPASAGTEDRAESARAGSVQDRRGRRRGHDSLEGVDTDARQLRTAHALFVTIRKELVRPEHV